MIPCRQTLLRYGYEGTSVLFCDVDGDGELEDSGRGFGAPVVDAGNLRSMWKAVWHNDLLVDEMKEMNWKETKQNLGNE